MPTRNYWAASPSFILVLEKAFGKPQAAYTLKELEKYYMIYYDGFRMGEYCQATKGAEGT